MKVSCTLIDIQTNLNNAYLSSNNVKSVRYNVHCYNKLSGNS